MPERVETGVGRGGQAPTIPSPTPADVKDTLPDAGSRFTSPPGAPSLPAGTVVDGKYQVDRLLGVGAMGQVYLARDQTLDRDVALKLVSCGTCGATDWRPRLLNEARTMARVRHENVVAMYAAGEYESGLYLAMEYVPGVDLDAWKVDRGPLSLSEAHHVLAQLSRGLQAIHDAGAVHRDVKPSNVLVSSGFRVALADFGLARWIDQSHISGEHGVVGTPAYVAPEMILGRPEPRLLNRVDIYSLGVLAFELVTGRLPFEGLTPARIILDHVATPAPPVARYRTDLPPSVGDAIAAAMDKSPEHRPVSATEFLARFERDLFKPGRVTR